MPDPQPAALVPPKPGYKTSEFWLTAALFLLTAVIDSGAIPSTSPALKMISTICATLKLLGYTASRTVAKSGAAMLLVIVGLSTSAPACGPTARQVFLRSAYTGYIGVKAGFVAWDTQHERELAQAAPNAAARDAALDAYEKMAAPVLDAERIVEGIFLALAIADATGESTSAKLADITPAIGAVVQAIAHLKGLASAPASQPSSELFFEPGEPSAPICMPRSQAYVIVVWRRRNVIPSRRMLAMGGGR